MNTSDDYLSSILEYASNRFQEAAFRWLVRGINSVYSAALHQVDQSQAGEGNAQIHFVITHQPGPGPGHGIWLALSNGPIDRLQLQLAPGSQYWAANNRHMPIPLSD